MVNKYMKVFRTFPQEILEETKKLGKRPSKTALRKYVAFLKDYYQIDNECKLIFKDKDLGVNRGLYCDSDVSITLYKNYDIITVLHETRHYIQYQQPLISVDDVEEDARGWSWSLVYTLYPLYALELGSNRL